MTELTLETNKFQYHRSSKGLVQNVDGAAWLLLMQLEVDDRFGNPEKHNGALMVDRNFQLDGDEPRERITFDSAINAFPVDFYVNMAGVSECAFLARLDAQEWRIQVFKRIGFQVPELIAETAGIGACEVALPLRIGKDQGARISVSLTYRGLMKSDLLAFATSAPEKIEPVGLSITTYNKQQYLLQNLDVIRSSNAYRSGLIDLLVVNNGDPIEGLADEIEELVPGNVGGTGGFRVAAEHFREKGRRHFVIMDDDIILPADTVDRFVALSGFVKSGHVGSLAEIENVSERLIKEQGANVSRHHVFGIEIINPLLNIQGWFRDQLYIYRECDYSGWWALMVDLEAMPTAKLPSFFFIKRDDITMGFESRRSGTPTVVFPNLLVAHGEEGASSYVYYDIRNDLVMRARNNDLLGISIKGLLGELVIKFFTYRLDEQLLFNKALADYLKGPQWLEARPVGETLQQVRRLAGKRVPLPEGNPVIQSEQHVPVRRMMLAWLRPSSWRVPDPLPLVLDGHRACVTEIGGYIAMTPYSKMGIAYHRRPANVFALARGAALLARLALTRTKVIARYQKVK